VSGRRTLDPVLWVMIAGGAVLAGALLYGMHRAALWAEDRGWIYYKNKRGPAPWLGTLESIYEPEVEYILEEESAHRIRADQDDSGDGAPGRDD
jgi:hypothetical protein